MAREPAYPIAAYGHGWMEQNGDIKENGHENKGKQKCYFALLVWSLLFEQSVIILFS